QIILFIVILFILPLNSFTQGYQIKIEVDGLSDTTVLLGYHYDGSARAKDTAIIDKKGRGVFESKQSLPQGNYFLFLPSTRMFQFLVDEDQVFTIKTDTSVSPGKTTISGSLVNERFVKHQQIVISLNKKAKEVKDIHDKDTTGSKKEWYDQQRKQLASQFDSVIKKTIAENNDNILGTFLKATVKVDVPEPPKDDEGNITDSSFQFNYYRAHYFDNFDYRDERLLYSPFYRDKIIRYVDKFVPPLQDSLIATVDTLIENTRHSEALFKYMLNTLLYHYVKSKMMGADGIYLHIAEKYYINEAHWADSSTIAKLKERIQVASPLTLGKVAPNSKLMYVPDDLFQKAKTDSVLKSNVQVGMQFGVHDIKADFLAIMFWSYDCSHCRKSIPKLHRIFNEYKDQGFKVIAMHTPIEKEKWTDFVNDNELYGWINAWSPFSIDYKNAYDIRTTNMLYFLDKDKKILAKHISTEQLEKFLEVELSKKQN
ncbi:MAG: DUF5106 domain-containing protein, partial [Bacteroidales bacterium]|nr:DUF5106 domain-containing protein [Bacteroidales bacterium]